MSAFLSAVCIVGGFALYAILSHDDHQTAASISLLAGLVLGVVVYNLTEDDG